MPEDDPREAYEAIMKRLRDVGASDLGREVETIVARGRVQQTEEQKHQFSARVPFNPMQAYLAAVSMVLAALDPIFMLSEASAELQKLGTGKASDVKWELDRLEPPAGSRDDAHMLIAEPVEPVHVVPRPIDAALDLLGRRAQKILQLADDLEDKTR